MQVKTERLDQLLLKKELFQSKDKAQRAIMAGLVKVNEEILSQVGMRVPLDAVIEVKRELHPYVSRGGLKLEKAIQAFQLNLTGRIMIDIGASTGGFTDCALRHQVKRVYAIDVGYGQLAWKLRQDPRVIVMERTNFRHLTVERLTYGLPDLATIDVSFISLGHIFPTLRQLLAETGEVIALIKPQFEAAREQVGKKGVIREPEIHQQVLHQTIRSAHDKGFELKGLSYSPVQGSAGNIEFLARLTPQKEPCIIDPSWEQIIAETVKKAHQAFQ